MKTRTLFTHPESDAILGFVGDNIRNARKRRKLSEIRLAGKASVTRAAVIMAEKGDPALRLGELFNILRTLGLQDDLRQIAASDPYGLRFEELEGSAAIKKP